MLRISRRSIDITGMMTIVQRRIPVLTLDSRKPGPTVWLSACIHGDEPGGAIIVHDVLHAVRESGMRAGTIRALPLVNPMGFENVSRYINADREDLNRCFPGDAHGSMGERFAHKLFELVTGTDPDIVIDLHNDWIQSVPYLLLEPPARYRSPEVRQRTIEAARATGLLMVQDCDTAPDLSRTLTAALVSSGVPALTIEAGGACGIVETGVAAGTNAVLGVLRHLGVIDGPASMDNRGPSADLLEYTNRPLSTSSGIVRFSVSPGDAVKANQKLARIYSAFGSLEETLRARAPGFVLGVADHARAMPGSEVIAIAEIDEH